MTFDDRLNRAAETYHAQGYVVGLRPNPDDLPEFARDFRIEIVARRDHEGCWRRPGQTERSSKPIPTWRSTRRSFRDNRDGGTTSSFSPRSTSRFPPRNDAREPTEDDIRRALADAERLLQTSFVQQALIAAWATLESAMRRRLHAAGRDAESDSSTRTLLNELDSDGTIQTTAFRELEALFQARSAIVHGFTIPPIDAGAVEVLVSTARLLLDESHAARKTA